MPYKGGVQLLPETQRRPTLASYTSGNGYFWFGIALGIAVIVVSAVFSSYATSLNEEIQKLDGQLEATENSRNKDAERTLLDAQQQSRLMKSLLAGKVYWSQALAQMERMMQTSVQLTRLDSSASKGVISFRATADSYAAVARQLAAFVDGTGIKDIALKSVTATPQGNIEFDGDLQIDTKALLNKQATPKP